MFACKGTLAAALAARAFVLENGGGGGGEADDRAKLALFGMGTDLTQGFDDMTDESASACSMQLNLAAMNSLQDTNVGHGEATKAGLEARAARFGGTAVWIDVEARLKEFGTFGTGSNPEHGWYPAAFRRKVSKDPIPISIDIPIPITITTHCLFIPVPFLTDASQPTPVLLSGEGLDPR